MSLAPYIIIRLSISVWSVELEYEDGGGWISKKERAERGLRIAFMPKAMNMVPNMLPAMRRDWDCEMREVGVIFSSRVDIRIYSRL